MLYSIILVLLFVFVCFAGQGIVGQNIIALLEKYLNVTPDAATQVYTGLVSFIVIVLSALCRVILKQVPVVLQGVVSKVFWWIAKVLFGDGVVLANNKDPVYVKQQLEKKHPELSIEVKK